MEDILNYFKRNIHNKWYQLQLILQFVIGIIMMCVIGKFSTLFATIVIFVMGLAKEIKSTYTDENKEPFEESMINFLILAIGSFVGIILLFSFRV